MVLTTTWLLAWTVGSAAAGAEILRLAVASNFAATAKLLALEFEASGDYQVSISSASSGVLYAQIINGAPFHILLAADSARPQALVDNNNALANSLFTYAIGELVLWSTRPELASTGCLEALRQGKFRHLAVANPKVAPYGEAAYQVLDRLKLTPQLTGKIIQGGSIAQSYQLVASGSAELGFIARSQWLETNAGTTSCHWQVPVDWYNGLEQQAVITNIGADSAAAQQFMRFLQSPAARELIQSAGYGLN